MTGVLEAHWHSDQIDTDKNMVEIVFQGRLGNQLYQYALGRIIAEELGFALDTSLPTLPHAGPVDGYRFTGPVQRLTGHSINLAEILADRRPRRLVLEGFFQRSEYYSSHLDRLRQWFNTSTLSWMKPHEDELVVHVRGGDLYRTQSLPHPNFPPVPYRHYASVIQASRATSIAFVCENADDPVARKLHGRFGGRMVCQTPLQDFHFIQHADQIVLSLSSLAWWAAWLSRAHTVSFPLHGFWHPNGQRRDVNVIVNEDRYRYFDIGVMDDWRSTPDQIDGVLSE